MLSINIPIEMREFLITRFRKSFEENNKHLSETKLLWLELTEFCNKLDIQQTHSLS